MSLNNIFQMIKADRYTADGREEIKKALAEETEDRTYNIGEISEKTGLQKTANGWVKPKKGNAGSAKRSGEAAKKFPIDPLQSKSESRPASSGSKSSVDIIKEKGASKINHTESKPEPPSVKAPKPSVQEYMKAKDIIKKYDESYKKQLEEYETGQRLRANGGGAILNPMYGLKPNDLSKNEEYMKAKDIIQRMEAKDSAPRVLTGDCKIKIRK